MTERPVDIVVRIQENVKKDLEKIEGEFRKFEKSVARVKSQLDVDDNGSIDRANQALNRASRDRVANIFTNVVGGDGFQAAMGGSGGDGGGDNLPVPYVGKPSMPDPPRRPALPGHVPRRFRAKNLGTRALRGAKGLWRGLSRGIDSAAEALDSFVDPMSRFGRWVVPTMNQVQNVVAALLPSLLQLGVAALGVATAFGAVALAGGAMVGLGLIGDGDTLAESMENAKEKLGEFKQELFEAFQPAAQIFAPFADRFLEAIPNQLGILASTMPSLTVFDDDVLATTRGIIEWLSAGLRLLMEYQPVLSEINSAFGSAIGSAILDFLRFVTEETYANQEALMELGATFGYVLATIYNFAKAFGAVMVVLKPVFMMIAGLTDIISNPLFMAILAFVGTLYALAKAVMIVAAAKAALLSLLGDFTAGFRALGTFAMVAGGAAAVGAGAYTYANAPRQQAMPAGVGGGGSVNNYNVNIEGDWSPRAQREMESFFNRRTAEQAETSKYMTGLGE